MKRASFLVLVAAACFSLLSVGPANAVVSCGLGAGQTLDPFGSCETGTGTPVTGPFDVKCGTGGTLIPGLATILTPTSGNGVQGCADVGTTASALPIHGRVGIFRSSAGVVTIFVDGDDSFNAGGAKGWDRIDINSAAATCKVRVRRGSGGSYWTTQVQPTTAASQFDNVGSNSGSANPDLINACAA